MTSFFGARLSLQSSGGFELWLQEHIRSSGTTESAAFIEMGKLRPQKLGHFGIGHPTLPQWGAAINRISKAAADDPDLAGRISIPHVIRPTDASSVSSITGGKMGPRLWQAFVRTDIVSTGLLTIGQTIEIQYMTAYDPAYAHTNLSLESAG